MLGRVASLLPGLLAGAVLCGCGSHATIARPSPTPPPSPTATVAVGFVVQVTPLPTRPPRPTPGPSATPFVPPRGHPYLVLIPASGPPASRTITIRGGNLPHSSSVSLLWSAVGRGTGIGTTVQTSRRGTLTTRFTLPASPPGRYDVLAEVDGVPYASAHYQVVSLANLSAEVLGTVDHERIVVRGTHFVPHIRLILVAHSVAKGSKPAVIGTCRTDASGKLSYTHPVSLTPGQYALRATSTSGLSSQMAETFFEVVF